MGLGEIRVRGRFVGRTRRQSRTERTERALGVLLLQRSSADNGLRLPIERIQLSHDLVGRSRATRVTEGLQ